MKCTNRIIPLVLGAFIVFNTTGCSVPYDMAFSEQSGAGNFALEAIGNETTLNGFAKELCVTGADVSGKVANVTDGASALLCDLNNSEVLYAKNVHERLDPASLTKVLTAYVALKYGKLDDIYTASANVEINESGASLIGLKQGDTMTLEQALHGLLMPSGNDTAVLIAEGISGSVDAFCQLMNEEAKALGATNSNFMNPHGLTVENHYTTAYDLYLIFKEAMKYDTFVEIINSTNYSTVYKDHEGNSKELICENSNLYLKGTYTPPENVKVIGGKTGTTSSARNCLILYSKDSAGNSYISVILKSSERGILYEQMTGLLSEITN